MGRWLSAPSFQPLAKSLEIEDLRQNVIQHGIVAARVAPVSIAAVVAIFIAPTKSLAKIVVVVAPVYVIATVAIRVFVVATPTVVPVCLSSAEAFLITMVHCLP